LEQDVPEMLLDPTYVARADDAHSRRKTRWILDATLAGIGGLTLAAALAVGVFMAARWFRPSQSPAAEGSSEQAIESEIIDEIQ